jgi:hypothetical protein
MEHVKNVILHMRGFFFNCGSLWWIMWWITWWTMWWITVENLRSNSGGHQDLKVSAPFSVVSCAHVVFLREPCKPHEGVDVSTRGPSEP